MRNPQEPEKDLGRFDALMCLIFLMNLGSDEVYTASQAALSLRRMSTSNPVAVLRSACTFLRKFPMVLAKHRMRIIELLPVFLRSTDVLNGHLALTLLEVAAEDITRKTEFGLSYVKIAATIMEALWTHIPAEVLCKLLEIFQGRLLSQRTARNLLTRLANLEHLDGDFTDTEGWERKLKQLASRSLNHLPAKESCSILHKVLMVWRKALRTYAVPKVLSDINCSQLSSTWENESNLCMFQGFVLTQPECLVPLFLFHYYGAILHACNDDLLVEGSLNSLLQLLLSRPSDKKGIILAIGMVASQHANLVFKVLEDLVNKYTSEEELEAEPHQSHIQNTLLECCVYTASKISEHLAPRAEALVARLSQLV